MNRLIEKCFIPGNTCCELNVAKQIDIHSNSYQLIYYDRNNDWELYGLQKDPSELYNIYGNADYKETQNSLKNELQIQMKKFKGNIWDIPSKKTYALLKTDIS